MISGACSGNRHRRIQSQMKLVFLRQSLIPLCKFIQLWVPSRSNDRSSSTLNTLRLAGVLSLHATPPPPSSSFCCHPVFLFSFASQPTRIGQSSALWRYLAKYSLNGAGDALISHSEALVFVFVRTWGECPGLQLGVNASMYPRSKQAAIPSLVHSGWVKGR